MATYPSRLRIARKMRLVGAFALLLTALVPSQARATTSTCSRSGDLLDLQIVIPPTVRVFVTSSGEIKWADTNTPSDPQDCNDATVNNINTVVINNYASEDTTLIIDNPKRFAPGATLEPTGNSEIEFDFGVNDRPYEDTLKIAGSKKRDRFVAGVNGIATNGDGDADVTDLKVEKFVFLGKGGRDFLSGGGGNGTGGAFGTGLTIYGNGGDDAIRGGTAEDQLLGSAGDDHMDGAGKGDVVFGNDGADVVLGRRGADELDGMLGRDRLRGHGGIDNLEGGPGVDDCDGGPGDDTVATCETGGGD